MKPNALQPMTKYHVFGCRTSPFECFVEAETPEKAREIVADAVYEEVWPESITGYQDRSGDNNVEIDQVEEADN